MDISRRGVLGVLGAGIGSVGLAAAAGKNNSTSTTMDNEESKEEQNENENEGSEESERGEQNEHEDENEKNEGGEDDDQNEASDNGQVGNVDLSEQQAKDLATQEVGGGTVRLVELEVEDDGQANGTPVYNVVVETTGGTTKEVTIDANSENVVNVEQED